ncbi:MAG: DEAD/DEAH box helicase [Aeriscardovia sp.]|nr:DEAD/DEAH box helicase [Aeriscardovia sp.]
MSPAEKYRRFQRRQKQRQSAARQFAQGLPFDLDNFQEQALESLESGRNVLVAAPTGAGKTVVADFAMYLAWQQNVKAFYTTPIKALSNQKYHDLVRRYGTENVGLLTGDLSINPEASIIVMTTEVLRNMIYERSTTLEALRYVVLDEIHYLGDKFRGQVWEEVIIHLPKSIKIVGLSATVSNVEDFADWVGSVRGATDLVVSEHRPVPLEQNVILQQSPRHEPQVFDLYAKNGSTGRPRVNRQLVQRIDELERTARKRRTASDRRLRNKQEVQRYTPSRWAVVDELDYIGMLPGIYFIFSRTGCEKAVEQCLQSGLCLTTDEEAREIRAIADSMVYGAVDRADLKALDYLSFRTALENGFAAHHAGMAAVLREIVEKVFEKGLLKVVFATETLALGINMPARSVIIEKLEKFNGVEHVPLTPGEYTQLTGRAGRRGIDTVGHAVVVDSHQFDPLALMALSSRRVYPLHSQFAPTFNMAVNLLHLHDYRTAREMLNRSFAQWEANHSSGELESQIVSMTTALHGYEDAFQCQFGDFKEFLLLRERLTNLERGERNRVKRRRYKTPEDRVAALEQVDRRIEKTRKRERVHACRQCPDLQEHLRWGQRWLRLRKRLQRAQDQYASRTESVARRFDLICDVLLELGYIEDSSPARKKDYRLTDKGELLRNLFTEQDILLAECLEGKVFDGLTPQELASVVSAIVYEPRYRDSDRTSHFPGGRRGRIARCAANMTSVWEDLDYMFQRVGLDSVPEIDFGAAEAVFEWSADRSLDQVLREHDWSAGDFVRTCKRLCDVLGQIAHAIPADENLAACAEQAQRLVNKGVVAYSGIDESDAEDF